MAGDVILGMVTLSTLQVALCAKTTCTASEGAKGEQATITCHFKGNVSHESDSVSVHKLGEGKVDKGSILDCFWEDDGHTLQCYNQTGYMYDVKDWRNLTVIIPEVSEKHVGQYVCQTMLSDADDHESCKLTLQDTSVPDSRRESEKDPQRESCNNTVVIVLAVLLTAVSVLLLLVVFCVWGKRIRNTLARCCLKRKRKTAKKCANNGDANALVPKIRLLIAGKTGNGKSTLANRLLGNVQFEIGNGRFSETTTAQSEFSPEDRLEVVEIPDICNSDMPEAKRKSETSKLREFVSKTPAPYVVLVVRCDVVYTGDEYALYNKLKKLWGNPDSFCDQLVVAFCFGDRLTRDDDPTTKVSSKLRTVLEDAGHRYVVFNNNEDKNTAVANLLHILPGRETQDLG